VDESKPEVRSDIDQICSAVMADTEAVEEAERLRWMLVAAQARIDVFRTLEASNRNIDRNTQ